MAVYSAWGLDLAGLKADTDLSSNQWFMVTTASTAGNVKLATGASGPIALGALQNDPVAGDEANVRVLGTSKVWANGGTAISYGDFVITNASAMVARQASASSIATGIAMEDLASGCAIIEVLLLPNTQPAADNAP